jgi:hypothetical protein
MGGRYFWAIYLLVGRDPTRQKKHQGEYHFQSVFFNTLHYSERAAQRLSGINRIFVSGKYLISHPADLPFVWFRLVSNNAANMLQ